MLMTAEKNKIILDHYYASDKNNRKFTVDHISEAVVNSGIPISITKDELYLLLDEAITNAMEHGNSWDPEKNVHVKVTTSSRNMIISIEDQGRGFNARKFERSLNRRDTLSIRGRGIYIISQFGKITWNTAGNILNVEIPVN